MIKYYQIVFINIKRQFHIVWRGVNRPMGNNSAQDCPASDIKVKSLVKAIRVLECYTSEKPHLGVSEISEMTGYNKATVYNIASTLAALGYLNQDPETQKYSLGLKFLHFSYIINSNITLSTAMEPYLQRIADITQETVFLGMPYEDKVLYLDTKTPTGQFQRTILGEKAPMYCTGLGKCFLAYMPQSKIPQLPDTFPAFTVNTITTKECLMKELEKVREKGYAVDNMEHEFGVSCVAVPLFGQTHEILAAVSVSGPSLRFDTGKIEMIHFSMKQILEEVQYVY